MRANLSASEAKSWSYCVRKFWYDRNPPEGFEPSDDPFEKLLQVRGQTHELAVKQLLGADMPHAHSEEETKSLMEGGVPAIYQPVLVDHDEKIVGRPDFLIKEADQAAYQVVDAKLAFSLKNHPEIKIQLGVYRRLMRSKSPALVYLGNGEIEEVSDEVDEAVSEFLANSQELLGSQEVPSVTFGETKCSACPYDAVCRPTFVEQGELTLVPGLDARSVPELHRQGIRSIGELSTKSAEDIEDAPYLKGPEKKKRLVFQAKSLNLGEVYEIEGLDIPEGTWVHFDVESNPLAERLESEVYLWGLLPPPHDRKSFEYCWNGGKGDQDKVAWLEFLDRVAGYRQAYPDLILAHYTPYEVTQIKAYSKRYDMATEPTVKWLLGSDTPLFDLAKPVRDSLILPVTSYGLKQICKDPRLVNFQWELTESSAQWSVVRYLDYLAATHGAIRYVIKKEIVAYNRDDVAATRRLEMWLRNRGWEGS